MKIDTSSYYPQSPLDDEEEELEVSETLFGSSQVRESSAAIDVMPENSDSQSMQKDNSDKPTGGIRIGEPETPPTRTERVIEGISHFLSWIFVPLFMPVYGILLAFGLSILSYAPGSSKLVFTIIVAGLNVLIPGLLFYLLKRMGIIQDIGLNGQKERLVPYVITILCLLATAIFFYIRMAPSWLTLFFAGGAAGGLVNMIINFRWKISAHAAGIAGVVALIVRIMHSDVPREGILIWLMIAIAASGLLGSARIWLGRHTVWQVLAGFAVGFCAVFFLTMIPLPH